MTNRAALGSLGEEEAALFLSRQGWQIKRRNWRLAGGEIDILAEDTGGSLVVVEVKTRRSQRVAAPHDAIDYRKRRTLERLARAVEAVYPERSIRVDAISVLDHPHGVTVAHVPDILN